MLLEVTRFGEFEFEVHSPRNPIGRPGTNGNRVRRKHVIMGYLDAGNTNPVPKYYENPLVVREPMNIEFAGEFFPSLHSTSNLSPVRISHIGGGLESVDTAINMTSREWRPGGASTND